MPSARAAALRLERFVPYRLSVLANVISGSIAAAYAERFELTIPQWRVLAVLAEQPGASAAEVAQCTAMDKVAVSRAVQSLLRAGRLEREFAPTDRRRSRLRLSRAGLAVHAKVVPMALAYESALLQVLPSADRAALDRILSLLHERSRVIGRDDAPMPVQ